MDKLASKARTTGFLDMLYFLFSNSAYQVCEVFQPHVSAIKYEKLCNQAEQCGYNVMKFINQLPEDEKILLCTILSKEYNGYPGKDLDYRIDAAMKHTSK
jgi:hypothetical protein